MIMFHAANSFQDDFDPLSGSGSSYFSSPAYGSSGAVSPDKISTPAILLCSDLFPAYLARRRQRVENVSVEIPVSSKKIYFSGEKFDQRDLDILLFCISSALGGTSKSDIGTIIDLNLALAAIGKQPSYAARGRIKSCLYRLEQGLIRISDDRCSCTMRLINSIFEDTQTRRCHVEINEDILASFRSCIGPLPFIKERLGLGDQALAKWMHGMSWLNGGYYLISVRKLFKLCGSRARSIRSFYQEATEALTLLKEMGVICGWERNPDGRIIVRGRDSCKNDKECRIYV
jgi:hypothetical protein